MKNATTRTSAALVIIGLVASLAKASEPCPNAVAAAPSPGVSLALSAGVTGAGVGIGMSFLSSDSTDTQEAGLMIAALSLAIGPSSGQFYTGHLLKGTLFSLGRVGFLAMATNGFLSGLCFENCSGRDENEGSTMLALGLAGLVGLTLWDIIDSMGEAKAQQEAARGPSLNVSPALIPASPGSDQAPALGLSLSGMF